MEKITEALNKVYWDLLAEEGITKEDLELVNLDIGFSPVIAIRGEKTPVEVTETMGEKFIVHHPMVSNPVDSESLKVMRYRFLINRPKLRF